MKWHFSTLVMMLGFFACQSDEGEELNFLDGTITVEENTIIYQEALSQHEFSCDYSDIPVGSSFFIGKINGNDVCYVPDGLRYREMGYRVPIIVSLGPKPTYENAINVATYEFGIGAMAYENLTEDRIRIQMPAFPETASARNIVGSSMQLGELPLASDEVRMIEGFNVIIEFSYDTPLDDEGEYADVLHAIRLETAFGEQEGSRLTITDIAETETDSTVIYDLTLEVNCKLYWQRGQEMEYFGLLDEGVLKTRIVVDK